MPAKFFNFNNRWLLELGQSETTLKNIAASGSVGNMDGGRTPRPMYEGPTAVSNSLADAAKYYYDTDLRTSALSNCTGSLGVDGSLVMFVQIMCL